MSSPQLDNAERGFSFLRDGPLDMRMNTEQTLTAATWLADVSFNDLVYALRAYGEERAAKNIARAIEKRRAIQPITRTHELADLIEATIPQRDKKKHPATKTFQAIRIVINQEMEALNNVLTAARDGLIPGGRLAIISFHSLEDRMVKQFLQEQQGQYYPRDIPLSGYQREPTMQWIAKKIKPGDEEIYINPRSRSATLRIVEKTS
jgi:16S rRNA (cytosine1402-N4)-methyltransferase